MIRRNSIDSADNVCELPKDKGPCKAAIKRFYYDSNKKKCKEFTYGGCQGNANNFESKEECQKECSSGKSFKSYWVRLL